jgi:5-methylcytosine-specific restriction protein A
MAAPLKRCLGCGAMTPRSRCRNCERTQDQAYDHTHRQIRRAALERDGYRCGCVGCAVCLGSPCGRRATTADHVVPLARGGTKELANYQAMCQPCNSSKRDR